MFAKPQNSKYCNLTQFAHFVENEFVMIFFENSNFRPVFFYFGHLDIGLYVCIKELESITPRCVFSCSIMGMDMQQGIELSLRHHYLLSCYFIMVFFFHPISFVLLPRIQINLFFHICASIQKNILRKLLGYGIK